MAWASIALGSHIKSLVSFPGPNSGLAAVLSSLPGEILSYKCALFRPASPVEGAEHAWCSPVLREGYRVREKNRSIQDCVNPKILASTAAPNVVRAVTVLILPPYRSLRVTGRLTEQSRCGRLNEHKLLHRSSLPLPLFDPCQPEIRSGV